MKKKKKQKLQHNPIFVFYKKDRIKIPSIDNPKFLILIKYRGKVLRIDIKTNRGFPWVVKKMRHFCFFFSVYRNINKVNREKCEKIRNP